MKGGGGDDGAIACSRQGKVEDDHDVHHSRVSAAQATGGLGALDEEQSLLDARDGEQPRLEIRIDRPRARKVAGVVVRIGIEAAHLHKVGRLVIVDAENLQARAVMMDNDERVTRDLSRTMVA